MRNMLTSLSEHDDVLLQEVETSGGWTHEEVASVDLRRAVRTAVIPRLCAALASSLDHPPHSLLVGIPPAAGSMRVAIVSDDVAGLAAEVLADDRSGAHRRIDMLRSRGLALETILVELLAPTACHIRGLWNDDLCGFADMALAFCTLRGLLRHYATEFHAEGGGRETGLRALLATPAHRGIDVDLPVFGLMLTSEFFRRAGWDTWIERDLASELYRETVRGWFDLVEVLATSETQLDAIAAAITMIRRDSPNPTVGVIVCGQVFADHPELVSQVGADLMALDPVSSLAQAEMLVKARLADHRQIFERAKSVGQVRSLERILVQSKALPRTSVAAAEFSAQAMQRTQVMDCVQAKALPTNPARKRLS